MTEYHLNQPIWIMDQYAGFFHCYRPQGMVRVGFSEHVTGRGKVGRWAEIPASWIKER